MPTLVRPVLATAVAAALVLTACGDDDGAAGDAGARGGEAGRFCDLYLDYLAEPSADLLDALVDVADDDEVDALARIIAEDRRAGRVLAADSDLRTLARERCQAEWVGSVQGAADTAGAAQAFFDAVVAGDRAGARTVAAENAIARFAPWAPVEPDPDAGTPTVLTVDEGSFTMALAADRIAECQVESGVVIACTLVG